MTVFSNTSTQDTKGTVYVVDDDDAIRDSLRWLLEANDYKIIKNKWRARKKTSFFS